MRVFLSSSEDRLKVMSNGIFGFLVVCISLLEGIDEAAMCWDCHGSHDIVRVKDTTSRVHPSNIAATCGVCHDNSELMKKFNIAMPQPGFRYGKSVHGSFVERGNMKAPSCKDLSGHRKETSYALRLMAETMKESGADLDQVFQMEIDGDSKLREWLERQEGKTEPKEDQ